MYDDEEEDLTDDPISLLYQDFTNDNVQKSSQMNFIEEDMEDDIICWNINPKEEYTDIVELSSDDENEEPDPIPRSSYGNKNFILPVTFLDSNRNVKLLMKCKPLSIRIVDCDKHPWYYRYCRAKKSRVNVNCLTLGNNNNLIKHDIKVEKDDEDTIVLENEDINVKELTEVTKSGVNVNCLTLGKNSNLLKQDIKVEKADEDPVILESEEIFETSTTANQPLDDKKQNQTKICGMVNSIACTASDIIISEPRSLNPNCEQIDHTLDQGTKSKDLSLLDFKRNSGLVGMTVSKKDIAETNTKKLSKKKTHKKHVKAVVEKSFINDIGTALSNLGTSVIPISENSDDNEPKRFAKDINTNNITFQVLPCKPCDTRDKINTNANSPTRCSLKITCPKILEKAIKLKKDKSKDASKSKTKLDIQRKAKSIFAKDQAVPKLNLKRRQTTENEEFYVIDSCKVPRCCNSNNLTQSQDPKQVEEVVHKQNNQINKQKPPGSLSTITPCTAINSSSQHTLGRDTPITAKIHNQNLIDTTLLNPRSYHKKLKLKANSLNTSNKNIQNKPINSECLSTSNNEIVNTSAGSLTSFLNKVSVSQVQSPEYSNTPKPNKSDYETPKKFVNDLTQSKYIKLKFPKQITTPAANTNENLTQNQVVATHDAKDTRVPSVYYMQVYNEQLSGNPVKEMQQSLLNTQPNSINNSNKIESDSETLKRPENISMVQNQLNGPKNIAMARDNTTANTNKPLETALNDLKKYRHPKQPDEYHKMKLNTKCIPSNTVNAISPSKTQVYNLPRNNTVILRTPPAYIQTSTEQTLGHPIQTVVNHRVQFPPKTPHERPTIFHSPWSFPPPNTNVAPNVPYMSSGNFMYPGNHMYPHWEPTTPGNHHLPPTPLILQHQRNSNLIPVQNQATNESILGSTSNGELIKKINIVGVAACEDTIVKDKQKMLETLNNAVLEQDDSVHEMVNSNPILGKKFIKPCPLSKKVKMNPEPNREPGTGYSPPILPIPSYQKALELLKQESHNSPLNQVENMERQMLETKSKAEQYGNLPKPKKLPNVISRNQKRTKKISLDEYLKRASKDAVDASNAPKRKYNKTKKNASENLVVDNNQDLGYDSDATVKL